MGTELLSKLFLCNLLANDLKLLTIYHMLNVYKDSVL